MLLPFSVHFCQVSAADVSVSGLLHYCKVHGGPPSLLSPSGWTMNDRWTHFHTISSLTPTGRPSFCKFINFFDRELFAKDHYLVSMEDSVKYTQLERLNFCRCLRVMVAVVSKHSKECFSVALLCRSMPIPIY